jgi:hypothetical protein
LFVEDVAVFQEGVLVRRLSADEIRRAIEAADRITLPSVTALLWRAYGDGQITEAEAEALSVLIEARTLTCVGSDRSKAERALNPTRTDGLRVDAASRDLVGDTRRAAGSRPRTDASMERRRRWAASGRLPPAIAARFTLAEQAVLALVAAETVRRKDCRLAVGQLAAIVGVAETTVRNAIHEAVKLGLVTVEERRITGFRNDTNIVRIVSLEWTGWLRLTRRETRVGAVAGGGCKFANPTPTQVLESGKTRAARPSRGRSADPNPTPQAAWGWQARSPAASLA